MITSTMSSTTPVPAPTTSQGTAIRPNVEWWDVGGARYESTADLVKKYSPVYASVPAVYHWRQDGEHSPADRAQAIRSGALRGAAGGGVAVPFVLAVAPAFDTSAGHVVGDAMLRNVFTLGGHVHFLAGAAIIAATGAVVGAVVGAIFSAQDARDRFETGTTVEGEIHPELQPDGTRHLDFYIGDELANKVDLNDYANAQPGPVPPNGQQPWWMANGYAP